MMDNNTLNTINSILESWAVKFGTTVEKLVPEMQKYYSVQYTVTVIAWLIIFIAMIIVGKRLIKKHNEIINRGESDYDELNTWGYGIWVFSIIPFIMISYFTTTLFQWILSPSAALIDKIISIMRNQ